MPSSRLTQSQAVDGGEDDDGGGGRVGAGSGRRLRGSFSARDVTLIPTTVTLDTR
jgi:hypothetical protein